jgi:hypothetical protein
MHALHWRNARVIMPKYVSQNKRENSTMMIKLAQATGVIWHPTNMETHMSTDICIAFVRQRIK